MNSNSKLYHVDRGRCILAIGMAYPGGGSAKDREQFSPRSALPQKISLDTIFGIVNSRSDSRSTIGGVV